MNLLDNNNNNKQPTFYDLLNININDNIENIKLSYKSKINYFKNKSINENDIIIIKRLKTAFFILSHSELRYAYNNLILQNNLEEETFNDSNNNNINNEINNSNNNNTSNNIIKALNDEENVNLDKLFESQQNLYNIDNINKKKDIKMNNIISERVFSIPNNNKIMYNNILPLQTRDEKKLL